MLAERFGVAPLLALIPLSLAFGFQHLVSGFGGVAYACFFGLLFSLIYLATGSLYPAIAAHAAGNSFTIFYTQPRLERRLALDAQPAFLF